MISRPEVPAWMLNAECRAAFVQWLCWREIGARDRFALLLEWERATKVQLKMLEVERILLS